MEEKVHIFRDLGDCNPTPDDTNPPVRERMLFRATPDDVTKGEPIIKDALKEGEHGSELILYCVCPKEEILILLIFPSVSSGDPTCFSQ